MVKKRKVEPKSSQPPSKKPQIQPPQQYDEVEEVEEEEEEEDTTQQQDQDQDQDEDPIPKLLEPFGRDQILSLLCEAAAKHRDVADRIRRIADEDAVHRKIFVHGLGWDTTAETLMNAFRQYGEIEDCKAVTDKVSGKSKGYGFILFKTRRGARNALKQPQKKIGNRMTACQLASTGPAQPQQQSAASSAVSTVAALSSEYTQRKIYVSNVSSELDPQKLLGFFSRFGEIEEGPLGLDKMTGKPKGFCLFVYKSGESARRALEEPHKKYEGHILHCQKAIDGPKLGIQQQQLQHGNAQRTQFQRNDTANFGVGGVGVGAGGVQGHLMAPAVAQPVGISQLAGQQLNPAIGQALTALLASQGASLGLTNYLGGLESTAGPVNSGIPSAGHVMAGGYTARPNISSIGGYANQVGLQAAYPNQQIGQGGTGRGQHGAGAGQYGGVAPYMGH